MKLGNLAVTDLKQCNFVSNNLESLNGRSKIILTMFVFITIVLFVVHFFDTMPLNFIGVNEVNISYVYKDISCKGK